MQWQRLCRTALIGLLIVSGSACAMPGAPPPTPTAEPTATATPAPTATATPTPRPAGSGRLEVDALWAANRPEGFTGGMSAVQVAVEPNPSKEVRVGFFEEKAGGSGATWRASGWMAVIMSSFLLGINPTDYRYTYEIGGYADGPSAGGLLTVATLAALLGHTVREDATMTGTINPDGTIGPVGGIPHKIEGAAKEKKKLVLIPAGQREARDENAKKPVDVVALGQQHGVEVREVGDVYQAYEALTGKPLPRPSSSRRETPGLAGQVSEQVQERTTGWLERYEQSKQQYEALSEQYRTDFTNRLMEEANQAAERARTLGQQGKVGAAYGNASSASVNAAVAHHGARAIESYINGGASSVNRQVTALKPTRRIEAMLERLGSKTPETLGDLVALADAYGNLGLAMGLLETGDNVMTGPPDSLAEGASRAVLATLMYVYADHAVQVASDSIDLGLGAGSASAPEREAVQRLAELFQSAAEANLNYFDNVVLKQISDQYGVSLDLARLIFASEDLTYVLAYSSLRATEPMEKRTRGESAATYATLGGGLHSYVLSSLLVAKYYSLDAETDDEGMITGVENAEALTRMLDLAEQRASTIVRLAYEVGGEPVAPVLNYEQAQTARGGSVAEQFSALGGYWTAALQGQMVGLLSDKMRLRE